MVYGVTDHSPESASPENMTRLRRFAIGLIKANRDNFVSATMAKLARARAPCLRLLPDDRQRQDPRQPLSCA